MLFIYKIIWWSQFLLSIMKFHNTYCSSSNFFIVSILSHVFVLTFESNCISDHLHNFFYCINVNTSTSEAQLFLMLLLHRKKLKSCNTVLWTVYILINLSYFNYLTILRQLFNSIATLLINPKMSCFLFSFKS